MVVELFAVVPFSITAGILRVVRGNLGMGFSKGGCSGLNTYFTLTGFAGTTIRVWICCSGHRTYIKTIRFYEVFEYCSSAVSM